MAEVVEAAPVVEATPVVEAAPVAVAEALWEEAHDAHMPGEVGLVELFDDGYEGDGYEGEVEPEKELARLPERRGGESYVLPWGDKFYHVYKNDVISLAENTNAISSAEELGQILGCSLSDDWYAFVKPEYLLRIKGVEGNQVFTTFDLQGVPSEKRILRLVPNHAADHCFHQHKDRDWDKMMKPANERQRIRMQVLDWFSAIDAPLQGCDEGYVLSPITNGWPEATFEAGTAAIWPGPRSLTRMASVSNEDFWELDLDREEEEGEAEANGVGERPTAGPLRNVPFVRAPAHEAARMRAATECMRFAYNKMRCLRRETHRYVARLLQENVQAQQQQGDDNTTAIGVPTLVASEASSKARVSKAAEEVFERQHEFTEASYLEITNSLKRTWDMAAM